METRTDSGQEGIHAREQIRPPWGAEAEDSNARSGAKDGEDRV